METKLDSDMEERKKAKVSHTVRRQMECLSELSQPEQDENKWHGNHASMFQPENMCNIPQVTELR